jgi:putative redox protein
VIRAQSLPQAYRTTVSNDEIAANAPIDKGGGGAGFGAHELLEAALAVCINMAVRMHASEHSIPLESVSTRVRLDRPHPNTVSFKYKLDLVGPLSDQQRRQLEHAASICQVRQTLSKRIEFRALE